MIIKWYEKTTAYRHFVEKYTGRLKKSKTHNFDYVCDYFVVGVCSILFRQKLIFCVLQSQASVNKFIKKIMQYIQSQMNVHTEFPGVKNIHELLEKYIIPEHKTRKVNEPMLPEIDATL